MNLCVNVMTVNRPKYLYVCLDAIYRNSIIPDVYVYIDKLENDENSYQENLSVIGEFPVTGVFMNKIHNGVGNQFWDSFEKGFTLGYDYCLYLEDDWLITTDAFKWLYECPKVATYYSIHRWTNCAISKHPEGYELLLGVGDDDSPAILKNGDCLSWCLMFYKESFDFINKIKKARAYLGQHPALTLIEINRMEQFDWDRIMIYIAATYKTIGLIPPKPLLAHFGNRTCMLEGGYGASGDDIQNIMFAGDKTQWLNNIANIFETYSIEDLGRINFAPITDFKYH